MTETTETSMAVNDLYLLADYDIAKDRKEGKNGREGGLAVDDKERYVVDFEAVGEISNSGTALVCMSDYDDLVSSVDKLLRIVGEIRKDGVVVVTKLTVESW